MEEPTREFEFEEMASRSARCATLAAIHLVAGDKLGRLLLLDGETSTLGRSAACDLQFQVDGVSRRHARIERSPQNAFTIYDTDSTNGLFVNGFATHEQALKDGDRVALGPNLVFTFRTLQADEAEALEALSVSRSRDPVTGVLNAAYFEEMLSFELELGQRRSFDVALLCVEMLHVSGGQVDVWAKRLARCLEDKHRPGSLLGRLGPTRFVQSIVYVSRQEVEKAEERVRSIVHDEYPELTILLGTACSRELANATAATLMARAARLTKAT